MPGDGPGPGRMTRGPHCPHQPSEHTLVVDAPRCHCVPGAGVQAERTPPVLRVLGRTGPSRLGIAPHKPGHEGQVPPPPGNTVPWPQKRTPAPHVRLSAAPPARLLPCFPPAPRGALTVAHIPAPGAARPAPDGGRAPFSSLWDSEQVSAHRPAQPAQPRRLPGVGGDDSPWSGSQLCRAAERRQARPGLQAV